MRITVITDNKKSWFIPFGKKLVQKLNKEHRTSYVYDKEAIIKGDVCFILSCSKIIEKNYLKLNKNNIVVHGSDLPRGKGFSPLQWQILDGRGEIVITLLEAVEEADAGPYYFKSKLCFKGTELLDEMRLKLGNKIIEMCLEYIEKRKILKPIMQKGQGSFYQRRFRKDDELNINETIKEQFSHFRIADNERFPLYFQFLGRRYIIKIYRENKAAV